MASGECRLIERQNPLGYVTCFAGIMVGADGVKHTHDRLFS